jgi:hypothetical protein
MNTLVSLPIAACIPVVSPSIAGSMSPEALKSPEAQLARLERAIELLRTAHVCEGWQMDEAAAERALRYFRRGLPDDEKEWRAAVSFISLHGLSFDWILDGDVRVMVCECSGRSPRAKSSAATDPIFGAIEAHKKAYAALDACLTRKGVLEDRLFGAVRHLMNDLPERYRQLKALQAADPEWVALEMEKAELREAEDETIISMIEVRPRTLAGAAALLRHVVAQERLGNEWPRGLEDSEMEFDNEDWVTFLHRNIAEVIEEAARV